MAFGRGPLTIPDPEEALPGRAEAIPGPGNHVVNGRPLVPPFPESMETVVVGMGCFWGAERKFWSAPGVVLVVFDPTAVGFDEVLRSFWENHDPTQGMRQGNDVGTQYRSGIYVADGAQRAVAEAGRGAYATRLAEAGFAAVTTEIVDLDAFYYAEDHHQQYLARNPMGYCGIGGTGVTCPTGVPG